jgi:hypothetical protein
MSVGSASDCGNLATSVFTLPTLSNWVDPSIGPEPIVTGAASVIGGVLQ